MHQHASTPGISELSIQESSEKYSNHVEERVKLGHRVPLKEGILIWDETKACKFLIHYIDVFENNV